MLQRSGTWVGATARDIARAVRRGDTSATAVVADHLDSITAHDRVVNAFRLVRPEAVAEAEIVDEQPELSDLTLAGVPIAVKENTAVTGLPTWNGSNAARKPTADADHEVVRRLRGAGAVVLGVTRMSELGSFCLTDDVTGVTRNPWRTDRTPGGSSGGSAAAVAAGLVPIAHGTDSMGSVRIPAACCGLVGIKAGSGVVPTDAPAAAQFAAGEHGVLATTVADAALGFFALAGRAPQRLVPPHRLRFACSTRSPVPGTWADAGARKALSDAGRALIALGHDAVSAQPNYSAGVRVRGLATWFAAAHVEAEASGINPRELQPRSRRHIMLGRMAMNRGLVREVDRAAWREYCRDWFADNRFDVLVTPALATAPPLAREWATRSWGSNVTACLRFAPYQAPWNLAGFPAVVVPTGVRPDGLPAAVQLVGPPGSELTLLAVAGQLEHVAPWRRHAPGWPRAASRRFR